ncbi:MAG: hypothetical protein AAF991_06640 [Pseudomonadota bacterium]
MKMPIGPMVLAVFILAQGSGAYSKQVTFTLDSRFHAGRETPDQLVEEGERVLLRNPAPPLAEGNQVPKWIQVLGPEVELTQVSPFQTEFLAPYIDEDTLLIFRFEDLSHCRKACAGRTVVEVVNRVPETIQLNGSGNSAVDPEIHPRTAHLVLQSEGLLHELPFDPESGLLLENIDQSPPIAEVASLVSARNGPEYGEDTFGNAVYFNAVADNGTLQFFQARADATDDWTVTQLTSGIFDRINQLPSQNPTSLATYLVYATRENSSPFGGGWISYLNTDEPDADIRVTPVRPGYAGFRWIRGTSEFLTTVADGTEQGQVLHVNAATGEQRVLTNDRGVKFDPYGWYPPEFGGNLAFHATTDLSDITIYRDTGGEFFEEVAVLKPPLESDLRYVQSAEPFVTQGGRSLISLTLKDHPGSVYSDVSDSQIWIYGIDDGIDRFSLRCDNGAEQTVRHEAELVSGTSQVFVYYNVLRENGQIDMMLCRSSLAP